MDIVTFVSADGALVVELAVWSIPTPGGGARGSELDGSSLLDKLLDPDELLYELDPRLPVEICSFRLREDCETPCYRRC